MGFFPFKELQISRMYRSPSAAQTDPVSLYLSALGPGRPIARAIKQSSSKGLQTTPIIINVK